MSRHFLLPAAATLWLRMIYEDREDAGYPRFCQLLWPKTKGAPFCLLQLPRHLQPENLATVQVGRLPPAVQRQLRHRLRLGQAVLRRSTRGELPVRERRQKSVRGLCLGQV